MKYLKIFSLAILLINIFSAGCNKTDNPVSDNQSTAGSVLMPLKVGNQWLVTFALYDSSGMVIGGSDTILIPLFSIVKDTLIQTERWFLSTGASLPPACFDSPIYLTNRTDGLWGIGTTTGAMVPYLIAKYPASVNESFVTGKDTACRAILVSKNASVTVPRGTYSCYQYTVSDKNNSSDLKSGYFMMPDSGFIRAEQYAKTSTGQYFVNVRYFSKY